MEFRAEAAPFWQCKSDISIVAVVQDEDVSAQLQFGERANPSEVAAIEKMIASAKEEGFSGKSGQIVSLPTYGDLGSRRVLLVGVGKRSSFEASTARKLAANMARRVATSEKTSTVSFTRPVAAAGQKADNNTVQAFAEGWILGSYSFQKYKTPPKDEKKKNEVKEIVFCDWQGDQDSFKQQCDIGASIAEATNFSRALIAEPASYMTPSKLAEEAQKMAADHNFECRVIDAAEAKQLGMGSFLGVARGAKEPPKFLSIKYDAGKGTKTVAIVGKGITFDSGGLSLKPAASMEHMKYDMAGAAAVLGAMQVVGKLKPKLSVLCVIAATENMPGDAALHPGDILKAMNGKTIEVNNTDAEGRLVLADALCFVNQQGADEIIDIATLTGAIVSALGRAAAGIMGTDQALIDRVIKAGAEAGEKLWQLPLYDEYKDSLKSDVADLKNAGSRGEAGSCCAAMFLKEFVDSKPWAHLDICGPGWVDKDKDEVNKGGTAFGVRTLSYYLLNVAASKN